MYIGEIIKEYRTNNKLSQRAFAKRTSLSPSYINTLEKQIEEYRNKKSTDAFRNLSFFSV